MTRKLWDSASPGSDKFNLSSAPILIFSGWKWNSGVIVFWINRAASLSVYRSPLSYLFLHVQSPCLAHIDTCIHTVHIYQKNGPLTLHVSVNQINLRQRRIKPVIHDSLLQGMITLHDHRGLEPLLWCFDNHCTFLDEDIWLFMLFFTAH